MRYDEKEKKEGKGLIEKFEKRGKGWVFDGDCSVASRSTTSKIDRSVLGAATRCISREKQKKVEKSLTIF